jgi:hypothetical protein
LIKLLTINLKQLEKNSQGASTLFLFADKFSGALRHLLRHHRIYKAVQALIWMNKTFIAQIIGACHKPRLLLLLGSQERLLRKVCSSNMEQIQDGLSALEAKFSLICDEL